MPQSLPFFTRALAAFLSSTDPFRVLATAPHLPLAPRPPPASLNTLIVLDSSFNPPTTAHAQMARSAMQNAGPGARLLVLLAVHNADKPSAPAPLPTRLGMMEAFARDLGSEADVAVTKEPFFEGKARSIALAGWYCAAEQVYLCGFDTLVRVFDEKYYGSAAAMQTALGGFFARARLRVTMRPHDGAEDQRAYVEGLGEERVELVGGVGAVVSSSRVREMVGRGDGVGDGLVGGEVRRWIEEEGLYREW